MDEDEETKSRVGVRDFDIKAFYELNAYDYETLTDLHAEINSARQGLYAAVDKLNEINGKFLMAEAKYKRMYSKAVLESNQSTIAEKKLFAEIQTEKYYNQMLKYKIRKESLERIVMTIKTDLNMLQSYGNDIRQEMKIV